MIDAPTPAIETSEAQEDGGWLRLLRDLVVIVGIVMLIHSCVAKPFYIPSPSMMPILRSGDRLIVSKYPYGWSYASVSFHLAPKMDGRLWGKLPRRGDIVVFENPVTRIDMIKRVIGLPGDRIAMRGGQIILNGTPVPRTIQPALPIAVDANISCSRTAYLPYATRGPGGTEMCEVPIYRETLPGGATYDTIDLGAYDNDDFDELTVKPGHLFVMGDNRDDSADSRVAQDRNGLGGAIPFELVSGRAEFITFSTDGTASWFNPISWFGALRSGRAGTDLTPDHSTTKD